MLQCQQCEGHEMVGSLFRFAESQGDRKKKRQNLPIQWSRSDGLWFYRSHNMRKIRPSSGQRRKSPSRATDLFSTSIKNSTEIVRQKGMGSSRSSNHGDSIGSNEARQVHWTFARGAKDTNKNSLRIVKEPGFSCEANRIFGEAPGGATQ